MARVAKDHHERRQEFLDTARELFYAQGYEETSVTDILNKLDLSKGTFYHYFRSKEELLDQLVAHLAEGILAIVDDFIDDPALDAITKLNKIYEIAGSYKAANKDLIMTLMRTMYSDKNIRMRMKMNEHTIEIMAPIMLKIINQGIEEGVFNEFVGQLTFEYLDEIDDTDEEFVAPEQVEVWASTEQTPASILWPVQLTAIETVQ